MTLSFETDAMSLQPKETPASAMAAAAMALVGGDVAPSSVSASTAMKRLVFGSIRKHKVRRVGIDLSVLPLFAYVLPLFCRCFA
jgi:hypothetical protein